MITKPKRKKKAKVKQWLTAHQLGVPLDADYGTIKKGGKLLVYIRI